MAYANREASTGVAADLFVERGDNSMIRLIDIPLMVDTIVAQGTPVAAHSATPRWPLKSCQFLG